MDPVVLYVLRKRKRKQGKQFWIHPLIQNRFELGEHLKVEAMFKDYPSKFHGYLRLSPEQFSKLEEIISPLIVKQSTNFREPLPPRTRLFIALRYLATGNTLESLATSYCVGRSTVQGIIGETCQAIWNGLVDLHMRAPQSKTDWLKIAKGFQQLWQLPNCVGALDGKHIQIIAPPNSGSQFFNYKKTFSIVLMATCDSQYRFTTVDIGAYGRQSDGGIFSNSPLGSKLEKGLINIDGQFPLPNSPKRTPLFFVGDEAFPLKTNILRPYPSQNLDTRKRIFNYRLSRGRRVIENCFGILSSRFRVLRKPIHSTPERACDIVKATVALHNFIVDMEQDTSKNLQPDAVLQSLTCNTAPMTGLEVRDIMSYYFLNEGQVDLQNESVFNIRS